MNHVDRSKKNRGKHLIKQINEIQDYRLIFEITLSFPTKDLLVHFSKLL